MISVYAVNVVYLSQVELVSCRALLVIFMWRFHWPFLLNSRRFLRNTLLVTNSCLLCYDYCSVTDLKAHLSYNKMYSYIGLLLSVPMVASPALKMVSAGRLLCIQCLQQLDFLLPLCVCFIDIIPKAKTEIFLILVNFTTKSYNPREYSWAKSWSLYLKICWFVFIA